MKKVFGILGVGLIGLIAIIVAMAFVQGHLSPSTAQNAHLNLEGLAKAFASIKIQFGGHQYNFVEAMTDTFKWLWDANNKELGVGALNDWINNGGFQWSGGTNGWNNIVQFFEFIRVAIMFFTGLLFSVFKLPIAIIMTVVIVISYILAYLFQIFILIMSVASGGFIIFA